MCVFIYIPYINKYTHIYIPVHIYIPIIHRDSILKMYRHK